MWWTMLRQVRVRLLSRRVSLWKIALGAFLTMIGLQGSVIAVLSVVALQRKRRVPHHGFPHEGPQRVALGDDRLQVYTYGRDLFDAMIAAIDAAKDCIYLETFIWKGDAVGCRFKEHLERKAAEGVKVYVIFDSFGNLVVPREFKNFSPAVNKIEFQNIRRPWHLIDPRHYAVDHRKLLIVDGRTSFIGGYNIGSLYATQWRDTHLRITGSASQDLAANFVLMWNRISRRRERIQVHYQREFDPTIQLHSNDPLRLTFPIRDMYINAIDRAQDHIYLTNAYFVPDHILLDALCAAADRGVDVQVLLPWTSNHILADWVARSYFDECLRGKIRIFGYKDVMIHAKTCVIDGQWSTIGTANLDRLSSVGNYELNVEIYNEALAHVMEDIFVIDKTNAFELTAEKWSQRPWYVRISERILTPLRVAV